MSDGVAQADSVFAAVRELVLAGEYLDRLWSTPQINRGKGPEYLQGEDGRWQRVFERGSQTHLSYRKRGRFQRLPQLHPALEPAVVECERLLRRRLPPLLRRLYLEVANGGFGPGFGLLGVTGGHNQLTGSATDLYRHWPAEHGELPRGLLPICEWPWSQRVSLVDCSDPKGRMWGFDPEPDPEYHPGERALFPQDQTFEEWLGHWVTEGTAYAPIPVRDSRTSQWRSAGAHELEDGDEE